MSTKGELDAHFNVDLPLIHVLLESVRERLLIGQPIETRRSKAALEN